MHFQNYNNHLILLRALVCPLIQFQEVIFIIIVTLFLDTQLIQLLFQWNLAGLNSFSFGYFPGTVNDEEQFYNSSCSLKATVNSFRIFFYTPKSKRTFCGFSYALLSILKVASDLCRELMVCCLFVHFLFVFLVLTWTFVFLNSNNGVVGEYGKRRPRSPKEGIQKLQL